MPDTPFEIWLSWTDLIAASIKPTGTVWKEEEEEEEGNSPALLQHSH